MEREEAYSLLELPFLKLIAMADKARREFRGEDLELCNIMNAKSGICNQDCRFCAQASIYTTGAPVYPLKDKWEMLKAAKQAKEIGAQRFDIVTSGDKLSEEELKRVCEAILEITSKVGIKICASLGALDYEALVSLKRAGLGRYHHNIETSPRYFPKIVSTHTFQERIDTIKAAKRAGLELCSGGIIGLGETPRDRIDMALVLKELEVDSVPINVLVPIKGTPLEAREAISCQEAIRTIAIFRIILKDKVIKIAAGRESVLKDFQALAFMAGANGMLIGGYLTIKGRGVEEDWKLVKEIKEVWRLGKNS